jgi:PKD repeat protein
MNASKFFSAFSANGAWGGLLLKGMVVGALALSLSGCLPIPVIEVSPSAPEAGESVTFDGAGTIVSNVPADTVAVSYRWTFGDGQTGSGASTTHTYERAGTYDVTLRVVDSAGRVGEAKEPVTVTASTATSESSTESTDDTSTSTTSTTTTQ